MITIIPHKTFDLRGSKLFFFEKKPGPTSIGIFIKAGSRYDEIGKEGTAHFLEHMLLAGTEKFPSKDLLCEFIENIGGSVGAVTNSDCIKINIQIPESEDIPKAMILIDQMLNHFIFDVNTVENERGSIISEYTRNKNDQKRYAWQIHKEMTFQGTDIAKNVIGNIDSIKSISVDDLKSFMNKHFGRNSINIIVAGDVDEKILSEELDKVLPQNTVEPKDISQKLPILHTKNKAFELYPSSKQASIIVAFRTNVENIKEAVCADLFSSYLGGGRSSVLAKKLRYEKGLVYMVNTSTSFSKDRSVFCIETDCENSKFSEVMGVINSVIEDFSRAAVPEEKFLFAKSRRLKSFPISLQSAYSWVHSNYDLVNIGEEGSVESYIKALNEISLEDLNNFVKKNFSPGFKYTTVCGNEDVGKVFDQIVK